MGKYTIDIESLIAPDLCHNKILLNGVRNTGYGLEILLFPFPHISLN